MHLLVFSYNFSNISEPKHSSTTPAMSSQTANPDEPPTLEDDDSRNSALDYEMEEAEMTGAEVVGVKKKKRRKRRGMRD
jgi:hypothetical protein